MSTPAYVASSTAFTSTSAAPLVFSTPSGTYGNYLIAAVYYAATSTTITPPSGQGWNLIGTGGSAGCAISVYGRFVGASDPTTFSFGISTGKATGSILAISGANPTTPVLSSAFAIAGSTTMTTNSLTPSVIGTLPIALFGLNAPYASSPNVSGLTSGWTEADIITNPTVTSQANEAQYGPLTTDTSTAITATGTWNSSGTTPGVTGLILVQSGTPSNVLINGQASGFAVNFSGVGATQTLTITQSGTLTPITLSVSDISKVSLSKTTVNPPSDTVVLTALAPTTANVTITASGA